MADNIDITPGSGATVATDGRTIDSTSVQVQRVDEIGSSALANGQVAPTTSAATLVAARDTRKRLILENVGQYAVWIGVATVTTANGLMLPIGASITLRTTALIQAITATGTGNIAYCEEYDTV